MPRIIRQMARLIRLCIAGESGRMGVVYFFTIFGLDLIGIGPQSGLRRLLEDARPIIGFDLNWRHEVQHITTALQLVASGYAVTVAPLLALQGRMGENLHPIRLGEVPLNRRLGSLWRAGERLAPEAEAVRRAIAAALRTELALRMKTLI